MNASDERDAQRRSIAQGVDAVLMDRTGYRCAFAIVWVQAGAAPVMAGYSTNLSCEDAANLLQGTVTELRKGS